MNYLDLFPRYSPLHDYAEKISARHNDPIRAPRDRSFNPAQQFQTPTIAAGEKIIQDLFHSKTHHPLFPRIVADDFEEKAPAEEFSRDHCGQADAYRILSKNDVGAAACQKQVPKINGMPQKFGEMPHQTEWYHPHRDPALRQLLH